MKFILTSDYIDGNTRIYDIDQKEFMTFPDVVDQIYEPKPIIQTVGTNGIINKKFHMYVKDISGKIIGEGISKSKKEAEQLAAKQALMYFGISN